MTHLQTLPNHTSRTLAQHNQSSLLEAIATGDHDAFWPLWEINHPYLYYRCLQWMNHRCHDADEALSRAMMKAWEKLPHYAHQIRNIKAWLSRLTYNICMDFYREKSRISYSLDEFCHDSLSHHDKLASEVDSPAYSLHRHELNRIIQYAISTLPERLREPCRLRFYENWSYPKLATHFRLTEPTTRKRIQQARAILRQRISDYLHGQCSRCCDRLTTFDVLSIT